MRRVLPASAFVVAIALRASAATFMVTPLVADAHDATPGNAVCETATGNGMCTLRAAIEEASALGGASTIDVPAGTYVLSVAGGCDGVALCVTGTPTITLNGAGAATTIVDADATSNPPNGFGRVIDMASGVTMTVTGVTFTNGASQPPFPGGMAGGVRNTGTLTLIDSVVSNCSGAVGGGIYNSKSLTLTRTVVSGNKAIIGYGTGGGLSNDGGTVMLTQTAIRDNHASLNGGGIFNFVEPSGGSVTLDGCELSGNISDGGGGGLEGNNFSVSTLVNTTVSGNMSQSGGAGILVYDSAVLNLNNVTITGNMASLGNAGAGGGISSNTGIISMKNTIVAGNSDGGFAPDCSAPAPDLTSQGYNLIGNATNCAGVGAGTNDITGVNAHLDVLALNANANGPTRTHALLAGSAAIDGGNPATPGSGGDACAANDQRGVARTQAGALPCDIGAYEALPKPTTTTTSSTTSTSSSSELPTTSTTTSSSSSSSTSSSSSLVPTTSTTVHVTTTAAPPSTTTTTTLPTCGGDSPTPTFASIACRIDALIARIAGEPGLGSFAPRLTQSVQTGKTRTADAAVTCRDANLKKTKKRLQQAAKGLTQYVHRLNGLPARKKLDPTLRQSFIDDGSIIKQALGTLRNAVHCPDDAPPS